MTVAQVLAAHASAQIAAAQAADAKRRLGQDSEETTIAEAPRSFIETWHCESTVIGMSRSAH